MDTVKIKVPATTANCGPGFDTLGMACNLYNELELTLTDRKELSVEVSGEGSDLLPRDEKNLVVQAIHRVLALTHCSTSGIRLKMVNRIPLARGLGSSAAAVVGGLVSANLLTGKTLERNELLTLATEMEGHPDNVAPALFGGITIAIMEDGFVRSLRLEPPAGLQLTAVVPDLFLPTKVARAVLPENVPLQDAVFNVGRACLLVGALCSGNLEMLRIAMNDKLHQPYREKLIPGLAAVAAAGKKNGAIGVTISGAGSTVMAYSQGNGTAIGCSMVEAFKEYGVKARAMQLSIPAAGVIEV